MAQPISTKINPKQEVRYVVYPDAAAAEAESKRIMQSLQTQETRDDPNTVTKAYFSWNVSGTTKRASLVVPNDEREKLTLADRGREKTRAQALADQDISNDGEGEVIIRLEAAADGDAKGIGKGK
jgi:hypothetical protein